MRPTWNELRAVVKATRTQHQGAANAVPTSFEFSADGQRVYFLGSTRSDLPQQILCKDLSLDDSDAVAVLAENWAQAPATLSREEQLLRERKRQQSSGITSFVFDPANETFVFPFGSQLYTFSIEGPEQIGSVVPKIIPAKQAGAQIDPSFCPSNHGLVCFVRNEAVWVVDHNTGTELQLSPQQEASFVTCGTPSYIVQEEFDRYNGYWWQPGTDDEKLRVLYEKVDDSQVATVSIPKYNIDGTVDEYKYPRAGSTNSTVSLHVTEFESSLSESGVVHRPLGDKLLHVVPWAEYIVRCGWTPSGQECWVQVTDRLQAQIALVLVPLACFGNSEDLPVVILSEESKDWINVHNIITFLHISPSLSTVKLLWASEKTGFRHLYLVEATKTEGSYIAEWAQVTAGSWVVDDCLSVSASSNCIMFIGAKDSPLERHLYQAQVPNLAAWIDGTVAIAEAKALEPVRITSPGFSHSVALSGQCDKFISVFSNVHESHRCSLFSLAPDGGSKELVNLVTTQAPPSYRGPESFSFQSAAGDTIHGFVFTPPKETYKPQTERYPTLLYVYGGPHVQVVFNEYRAPRYARFQMLADLGFVVVMMDCRGSFRRGIQFEAHLKNRMGTVEIADQVEGLEYLIKQGTYGIDPARIGIHGWSYGGYLSLMGLAQRPDLFKVAIAGAPVTTWEAYDTGYTERYMGLPATNPEGYQAGCVNQLASRFPDEEDRLLLVHGLIDENVHFNHTALLLDALAALGKPYQLQVYPQERHGVRSAMEHYQTLFLSYLLKHLKQQ